MDNASTLSSAGSDVFAVAPAREQPQASAFDAILEQSRTLICEYLDEAVAGMLDKADETLFARMNETRNREEIRVFEEAREVVAKERDVIEAGFRMRYLTEFKQRSNRARKIGTTFENSEIALESLELVATDDLDETLKFNDMAAKLRAYCDDELTALDQRVGVLLGDATLQANDNPFSPQVICDAYKNACRQLDAPLGVRRVLLKLFDDHVLDAIRAVYKDVNALLVQNSILPKIRYGIARGEERKTAPATAADLADKPVEAPAVDMSTVAAQDLFSILQRLAAANAAPAGPGGGGTGSDAGGAQTAAGSGAGAPVLQGAELLGSLTRIQRGDLSAIVSGTLNACAGDPGTINVLRELKATSVGAGMGQVDLLTLDIIAMLFDQLFDDPKVPNGVKGLIGRLQIPVLKVAIADKSFFSTKTHPARRLLDAVGDMASRLPADFGTSHPLFERLQAILQELVDGFQDDLAIFAKVREDLVALMAEEDRRIEDAMRAEAKRVAEMENLALAKSVAQAEIKSRVEARPLPAPIIAFLTQQWLKLLLLVHAKEGKESPSWKGALELMDHLVWSIAPKNTPEDRTKLGKLMPKLIKNLTTGMKFVGTEDSVREKFFADLMNCHKQAMGAPAQGVAGAPPAAVSKPESTAEVVQRTIAQAKRATGPSLDFSASVTVKNPYGGGEVDVESQDLDFTEAETADRARARREESIRRALDTLGMGTWVEFRQPDDPTVRRPARLIFVSPHKSRYLFAVGPAGKEIIQCSRAEIGRRLRIGEAVRLDKAPEESLFDRIMGALLGKLRGTMRIPLPAS